MLKNCDNHVKLDQFRQRNYRATNNCTWARSHRGRHYDCAYTGTVFIRFGCTSKQEL